MPRRELKIPACKEGCKAWHNLDQVAALMSDSRSMVYKLMRERALPYRKGTQSRQVYHPNVDHFMRGEPFEQTDVFFEGQKTEPRKFPAACEASQAEACLIEQDSSERRRREEDMKNSNATSQANILTPRVRRAQFELLEALKESLESAGLTRVQAEARLSALMADVWCEAEQVAARLPAA
jgi:hypothetical protein